MPSASIVSKSIALLSLLFGLAAPTAAQTQNIIIEPKGEYAQIDTRLSNQTVNALLKGSAADKQQAIKNIRANPQNYAPPVFYVLSNVLFEDGEKDEAAFWFYAGQLRARFDATRCTDPTARSAVPALNQHYGSMINQYTFQDLTKFEALIPKVAEWDRKTPHHYDQRWINLHGMRATFSGAGGAEGAQPLSVPKDQWPALAEKNRSDYLEGFREAMAQLKNKK